jgi:glycosyltransferase involved in cell wall biosynthesis
MMDGDMTSFLIPAYNEEALIGRAIASIQESAKVCGLDRFEIVVCNNDSTDRTAELAESVGARVILETHRQIARARNAAAGAAVGSRLVWLDADAILTPVVLKATWEAFESGAFCGGGGASRVGGRGAGLERSPRRGDLELDRANLSLCRGIVCFRASGSVGRDRWIRRKRLCGRGDWIFPRLETLG